MSASFTNKTILKILDYYKNLWALSHASALSSWDLETYMPPLGAGARGEALGRLSTISQKIFLDKSFVALIHQAEKSKKLNDAEKGVIRILLRNLKFYKKLPPKFLEEFSLLTSEASVVWRNAKDKNDFKLFEPHLAKIFDANKKMADYLGYSASPYDALLDLFEEGLTVDKVEPFFDEIRGPLISIKDKILKSPKYLRGHYLETAPYDKAKMEALNNKVLKEFWPDFGKNFRMDVSAHPFTTSFNSVSDTRITTWYHDSDFSRSLLATIHEFGHALYELQCNSDLQMTPVSGGSSHVIHESQSRFWENFVGRSKEFVEAHIDDFKGLSPEINKYIKEEGVSGLLIYFNKVSPGLLRVEADEVTYHLHIMLRFEIEKDIIENKIKIGDLKEIWNEKMKEYLGVTPENDSEGILQDIHWSMGSVGYFPTYSLGTFLGAQWEGEMTNKLANYEGIKKWLGKHVHKYGSTYTLQDLLKKNGMEFDPSVNLRYLEEKYSKIYGFRL